MDQTSSYLKALPSISLGVFFAVVAICIIVVVALAGEGKLCCAKCSQENMISDRELSQYLGTPTPQLSRKEKMCGRKR